LDEYNKSIAKDSALERRFQPVQVEEPSDADTLAILHGSLSAYEKHHGVKYSPEAVLAALQLSNATSQIAGCPTKPSTCWMRLAAPSSSPLRGAGGLGQPN